MRTWLFLVLIVSATIISSCANRDKDRESISVAWPNVEINWVFADPHAFVGKTAVLHGEVTEIVNQNAFTIEEDGETMLVVGAHLDIERIDRGDFVRVNGAIRDFDIDEIEAELGFALQVDHLEQFNDQPAVVAAEVTIGPTSVSDLADNAAVFIGRTVSVTGKVSDIVSHDTFALQSDDTDDTVLVSVRPSELERLPVGAWVEVTGVVQLNDPGNPTEGRSERPYEVLLDDGTVEIVAPSVLTFLADLLAGHIRIIGELPLLVGEIDDDLKMSVVTYHSNDMVAPSRDEHYCRNSDSPPRRSLS